MIGAGCGIGEHNLSQHSVKWCEKSGLGAPLWTNGSGVLTDPHMVRANLYRAQKAIHEALDAMNSLAEWPREQDYE